MGRWPACKCSTYNRRWLTLFPAGCTTSCFRQEASEPPTCYLVSYEDKKNFLGNMACTRNLERHAINVLGHLIQNQGKSKFNLRGVSQKRQSLSHFLSHLFEFWYAYLLDRYIKPQLSISTWNHLFSWSRYSHDHNEVFFIWFGPIFHMDAKFLVIDWNYMGTLWKIRTQIFEKLPKIQKCSEMNVLLMTVFRAAKVPDKNIIMKFEWLNFS